MSTLDQTGQADNTLVVFLSDHGESLGAHGPYLKGVSPFEETYRIPCIMRWPLGIVQPGRNVSKLVSMIDLASTLMELSQAGNLSESKGKSLVPWLNNKEPNEWRDAVFSQCNEVEIYYTQRIVRTEKYKFVYNPSDVDELYDNAERSF